MPKGGCAAAYLGALGALLRELVRGSNTAVRAVRNFLATRIVGCGEGARSFPPELLLAVLDAVAPAFRCLIWPPFVFTCVGRCWPVADAAPCATVLFTGLILCVFIQHAGYVLCCLPAAEPVWSTESWCWYWHWCCRRHMQHEVICHAIRLVGFCYGVRRGWSLKATHWRRELRQDGYGQEEGSGDMEV